MPRADFVERAFTCCICGATFKALAGNQPVPEPICGDCGLRHGPEKLRRMADQRRKGDKRQS